MKPRRAKKLNGLRPSRRGWFDSTELFRDKLAEHPLTLEDCVLAEEDLVGTLETEAAAG